MYNYNYGNLALYSQMGDHHMWIYGKTGLEFLKFPMGPLLTYALSVSVFQKEAIYIFSRLCYRKDCIVKISNLISFPLYTPYNVLKKKRQKCLTGRHKGVMERQSLTIYWCMVFTFSAGSIQQEFDYRPEDPARRCCCHTESQSNTV